MLGLNKRPTAETLSVEKGKLLSKFQTFVEGIKSISTNALKEKKVKLEEAKLATIEAEKLQKIADDNTIITSNFDNLLNNKNTQSQK